MSRKKIIDRRNHCKLRSKQRYGYIMNNRAYKRILQRIIIGKYRDIPDNLISEKDQYANRLYCIVNYANIDFLCVYDKFENQIRTFLHPPSGHFQTMASAFSKIQIRQALDL